MTPATWTVVGTVVTVIGVVLGLLVRQSLRSPEQQTALNEGYKGLVGGLQASLDSLQKADSSKNDRLTALDNRINELEQKLVAANALTSWCLGRIAQLVSFIRDLGHEPPDEDPRPPS